MFEYDETPFEPSDNLRETEYLISGENAYGEVYVSSPLKRGALNQEILNFCGDHSFAINQITVSEIIPHKFTVSLDTD